MSTKIATGAIPSGAVAFSPTMSNRGMVGELFQLRGAGERRNLIDPSAGETMQKQSFHEVVIIGAGLAGLSCARALHKHGIDFTLLEKTDRPGGRIKTDLVAGYLLDHGFQVLQTG